jgi:hypothetical protein
MDFIPMLCSKWFGCPGRRIAIRLEMDRKNQEEPCAFAVHEENFKNECHHGDYFPLTPAGLKAALECFEKRSGIKETT